MRLAFSVRRILGSSRCFWMRRVLRTRSGRCARRGFRVWSALRLGLAFISRSALCRTRCVLWSRRRCLLGCAWRTRHLVARGWSASLRTARPRNGVRWTCNRRLGWGLSGRGFDFRLIRRSCLFGRYTAAKCSWFRSSCNCRFALVHRSPLLRVRSSSSHLLGLSSHRGNMFFLGERPILSRWSRGDPT